MLSVNNKQSFCKTFCFTQGQILCSQVQQHSQKHSHIGITTFIFPIILLNQELVPLLHGQKYVDTE